MNISEKEKAELKKLARSAIETVLFGKKDQAPDILEKFNEKGGAFVTIKKKGDLRGCIGYIDAALPLFETVKNAAIHAAFNDLRFSPLQKNEWEDIDLEISILTPLKKIDDVLEIKIGIHGLYIKKGYNTGLLLPQVAVEYDWDRTTFLEHACYKAGLPKNAWQSTDVEIYVFSAEVF